MEIHIIRRLRRPEIYLSPRKCGICAPYPKSEPSEAVLIWRGEATQWMNSAACGGVKDMEFASTSAQSRRKFLSEKQLLFRQFNAAAQAANCAAALFYGIRSAKNSVWNLRLPEAALAMRLEGNPASENACAKAHPYGISQPRKGFARQAAGSSVRSRYSSSAVRCA